jgi:hypothetical protein
MLAPTEIRSQASDIQVQARPSILIAARHLKRDALKLCTAVLASPAQESPTQAYLGKQGANP